MEMGSILSYLDIWVGWQIAFFATVFEFSIIFTPEDDITNDIWWKIFLEPSTQDSEYLLIGLCKFFGEYLEPDPNFQVAKIAKFCIFFQAFLNFQGTSAKKSKWDRMQKKFLAQTTTI